MDRSGRRTAVTACALTVGVLFGGGAAGAAPAAADDRGTDASGKVEDRQRQRVPGSTESHTTSSPRGIRGPGRPDPEPPPPDPCPWWFPPPSAPPARNTQDGLVIGLPSMPVVTLAPVFGDGRTPGQSIADTDVGLDIPRLQPPTSPPAPSALVAPSPIIPPAVPAVGAPPFGPPTLTTRDLPAPGRIGPIPAEPAAVPSAPQLPEPQGYLPELRSDDLGRIASAALPGLAALVGMTLFGGAIGYRQARAGYLLRAAGAGRFLQ